MYESLQSEMACEGRGEFEREAAHAAGNCCHWCDRPIVGVAAEFVGGHPMHPACVDEHFGIDREEDADDGDDAEFEDDGQPTEYEEWQDYMGGDDWDHGQFDGEY